MIGRGLLPFALESAICAQMAVFAVSLVSSRGRRGPALYLLSSLSVAIALTVAGNLASRTAGWPWLTEAILFCDLLIPAAAYLYVRQIRHPAPPFGRTNLVHLLPAVLGVLIWRSPAAVWLDRFTLAVWAAYLGAGAFQAWRHRQAYAPAVLRVFVGSLLAALGLCAALRVVMAAQVRPAATYLDGLPYLAVLAAVFLAVGQIIFLSLRYPGLLTTPGSHVKYAQSKADPLELTRLADRLEALLRDEAPQRDPDFGLDQLATRLGVPARTVSQAVNARFGTNVPAYINQRRVQDAVRRLRDDPRTPIKVVMFDAGFRTKSIFNREFQRVVGVSPSAFRKEAGA